MSRAATLDALIAAIAEKRAILDAPQPPYDPSPAWIIADAERDGLMNVLRAYLALHLLETLDAIAMSRGEDLEAHGARHILSHLEALSFDAEGYIRDRRLAALAEMAWIITGEPGDRARAEVLGAPFDIHEADLRSMRTGDVHFWVAHRLRTMLNIPDPREAPALQTAMKAYLARHGLTLTTGAAHFGQGRDWLRGITSGKGKGAMANALARCLDRL